MESRILEGDANKYLYASRMRDAYRSLEHGEGTAAQQALQPYESGERWSHLRGFEWHHLNRQLHAERLTLTHGSEVYSVVYSPDGRVIASGGQDGLIKLWDQPSGRLLASLTGHRSCVNGLAYSHDGQTLISVSCDHTVKLWQAEDFKLVGTLEEQSDEVYCVALSPNGERFATSGMGSLVVVWDFATGRPLETVLSSAINVDFIAWRDNHNLVFTGATHLDAWNVDTGETQLIHGLGRSIAISPSDGDLVLGTNDGSVRSVSGPSVPGQGSLVGRGTGAASLKFLPANGWLAVGHDDGAVRISSWPEPGFRQTLSAHVGRVQSLAAAPMDHELATGSFDGTVKLWDLQFDSLARIEASYLMLPSFGPGSVIASSADLKYIALPTSVGQVEVFDVELKRSVAKRRLVDPVCALRFSGEVIVGYAIGGETISRWDWKRDVLETTSVTAPTTRFEAALSPDGCHLVTLGSRPAISDTRTGHAWWTLPVAMRDFDQSRLVFSADVNCCWIAGTVGQANGERSTYHQVFSLRSKQTLGAPTVEVFAMTDDLIVVDGPQQLVTIINHTSGKEVSRFVSSAGQQGIQISPDGRTVAAGDIDGHVSIWNVATGQLIATFSTDGKFSTDGNAPVEIRFSADSRRLAAFTSGSPTNEGRFVRDTCKMFMWSGSGDR